MVKKAQGNAPNINLEEISEKISEKFKNTDLNVIFIFGAILLILIVGTYALFSSESQNAARGNPACGKIVIAANGRSLASAIAPTLAEARYFLVVNPLSKKLLEAVKNPYFGQAPNPQLTYLVAGKGEEAVIVGSVDQQTYNVLLQFGIRVFGGYQGRAQKVIGLYRQARISAASLPTDQSLPAPALGGGFPADAGMGMSYGLGMQNRQGIQNGQGLGMEWGRQVMNQSNSPLPGQTHQVGFFDWMQQAFVCPVCNWRMRASRQGDGFPTCPNCGGQMALDMFNQNRMWNPFQEGPERPVNFYSPNPDMTGAFQCPKCNWRMYSQQGANEFPRCPNCGQIMKRTASAVRVAMNQNASAMNVGHQGSWPGSPPPIFRDADMHHEFRGVCENCHVVSPDIAIPANAPLPHDFRGVCSNCHQVVPVSAGMQNNLNMMPNNQFQGNRMQNNQMQSNQMQNNQMQNDQMQNNGGQDPNVAHMAIK